MAKDEWQKVKLNELGFVGRGKSRHRPRNAAFLYGGLYPFFQTGDIKAAGLYLKEYTQTYSEEGLAQSKLWEPGTLCITIAANIAESAILGIKGCFPDSIVGFIADPQKADVRFIKYYIDTLKLEMQSISRGTTQDNLSLDKLLTIDFNIPPIPLQHRIADILSTYDDLIENCQQRVKILEDMARNLYREWFVRFRFPGHEKVKMVSSPLGEIPEGWEVKKLGDVLELNYGKALTKENRHEGIYPVYGSSGIVGTHDTSLVKGPGIIVGRKGNIGSVFWCDDDFFVIDTAYFVTSTIPLRYLFYVLPTLNFINGDAAVPGLSRNQAYNIDIIVPTNSLIKKFSEYIEIFMQQIKELQRKTNNLYQTRDLLLPELMLGKIEIEPSFDEEEKT